MKLITLKNIKDCGSLLHKLSFDKTTLEALRNSIKEVLL